MPCGCPHPTIATSRHNCSRRHARLRTLDRVIFRSIATVGRLFFFEFFHNRLLAAGLLPTPGTHEAEAESTHDTQLENADVAARSETVRFFVLDGQRAESPTAGFWIRLAKQLPMDMAVVDSGDIDGPVSEIAAEVDRRLQANDDGASPVFLFIYNMARFRNLRKSENMR